MVAVVEGNDWAGCNPESGGKVSADEIIF